MTFLTQSRFPTAWKIFQYCIGGTIDKRKLSILKYQNQSQILEVGCSLGNIARIFLEFPNITYTGLDIDPVVIQYARKDYSVYPNFHFFCQDPRVFAQQSNEIFDYILFAGILHHVDNGLAQSLLQTTSLLLDNNGSLVVIDPLQPEPEDSKFIHWYMKLEQGQYVRPETEMLALLQNIEGLQLEETEVHYVGATPFSMPVAARFGVYLFSKAERS